MRKILTVVAGALLLAACSVYSDTGLPKVGAKGDPLATLAAFTLTDLQNADQLAQAGNDKAAHQCFAYLIPVVQGVQANQGKTTTVSGAFSGFEAARIAITNGKALLAGIPQDLNMACAPLVLDAQNTILGLAAKVGVTVGTAGLLPLVP